MKYTFLLLVFLLSGCAATHPVDLASASDVANAHARLAGERALVTRTDGSILTARIDALRADSVFVYELGYRRSVALATYDVRSIEAAVFRRPVYGRAGYTLGAVGGFSLGVALQAIFADSFTTEAAAFSLGAAAVGGLAGAAVYSDPWDNRRVGSFVLGLGR